MGWKKTRKKTDLVGEESHAVTAEKISVYTERSSVGTVLVNINAAFVGSVRALIPFSVLQLDPPVEVGGSCWRSWRCTYRLLSPCQTIHIINPFSLLQTPCAAHTSHFFTLFPPLPGDLNKLLENCIQQSLGNPPFSHKHPLFSLPYTARPLWSTLSRCILPLEDTHTLTTHPHSANSFHSSAVKAEIFRMKEPLLFAHEMLTWEDGMEGDRCARLCVRLFGASVCSGWGH